MTTPVDHRPYAAPTDLVTAADVARWLVDYPGSCAAQASIDLHERLDRERRQACRRGCFAHFSDACVHRQNERALFPMLEPEWATTAGECRRESIHRALAFRAAARAR